MGNSGHAGVAVGRSEVAPALEVAGDGGLAGAGGSFEKVGGGGLGGEGVEEGGEGVLEAIAVCEGLLGTVLVD